MELEPVDISFTPQPDRRPRMAEPLPVRLVAIANVTLPTAAGLADALDAFYVDLLGVARSDDPAAILYFADNVDLRFVVQPDGVVKHASQRPIGVIVPMLADAAAKFSDAGIDFSRQVGMFAGLETLLLLDPAGNWIEVTDSRVIG